MICATNSRHRWGEPQRFPYKTERACLQCDVVKVTRHEGHEHWIEFWRNGELIGTTRTPPCANFQKVPA